MRGKFIVWLLFVAFAMAMWLGGGRFVAAQAADMKSLETIENAIAVKKTGRVMLVAGDVPIDRTLDLGSVSGGVVEGKGASAFLAYAHPLVGSSTRLVATAKDRSKQTMIVATGSHLAVRDLSIFGGAKHELGKPRAACGLLITKRAAGLGTGDLLLDNVVLANLEVGVQAAVGVTENNCEKSELRKVRFDRAGTGLLLRSQQSMGFGLTGCEWYDATDCIRVEGGGKVVVDNAFVHHEPSKERRSFLRIAPRDQEKSIGPNNGFYHVTGLYADQNAANLKLVSMRPVDDAGVRTAFYCATTFDGFHISNESYTEPAIEVAGNSSTTLRDGYGVQKRWVTWDNDPDGPWKMTSRVVIDNCQIFDCSDGRDVIDMATARGWCHVIVRDCYDQFNRPVKDFSGLVLGERK